MDKPATVYEELIAAMYQCREAPDDIVYAGSFDQRRVIPLEQLQNLLSQPFYSDLELEDDTDYQHPLIVTDLIVVTESSLYQRWYYPEECEWGWNAVKINSSIAWVYMNIYNYNMLYPVRTVYTGRRRYEDKLDNTFINLVDVN